MISTKSPIGIFIWILIFSVCIGWVELQLHVVHRGSTKTCLPVFNCEANTYVKECPKTGTNETCEPCKEGEFQPNLISSYDSEEARKCFVPKDINDCPKTDTVYSRERSDHPEHRYCTKYCKCNTNLCFYGSPCFCHKRDDPCPKDTELTNEGECRPCPENKHKNYVGCGPCRYKELPNIHPNVATEKPQTTAKPPPTTVKSSPEQTITEKSTTKNAGGLSKSSKQNESSIDVTIPVVLALVVIVLACLIIVCVLKRKKFGRVITKFKKKTEDQQANVHYDAEAVEDPVLDQGSQERNPLVDNNDADVNDNGFQQIRPNGVVPTDTIPIDHYPSQEEDPNPGPLNSTRPNHGLKVHIPEPRNEPHPEKTPIPDNSPHDYNQKPVLLYSNSVEPTSPVEYPAQDAIIDSQPSSMEETVGPCPASNISNSLDRQVSDIQPSSPTQCTESPSGVPTPTIASTSYDTDTDHVHNAWFTPGAPTEHEEDTLCKSKQPPE